MLSKQTIASVALINSVSAEWGIFGCGDKQMGQMENFDAASFAGTWNQITIDYDLWTYTTKKCVRDTYAPDGDVMSIQRTYQTQDYDTKVMSDDNVNDAVTLALVGGIPTYPKDFLSGGDFPHYIIDTDYDNYAVAYGCKDFFFGFFHGSFATLLSRETEILDVYADAVTDFMEDAPYDYSYERVENGSDCGFSFEITNVERMTKIFKTKPTLANYGGANLVNNVNFAKFFNGGDMRTLPFGNIIDGIEQDVTVGEWVNWSYETSEQTNTYETPIASQMEGLEGGILVEILGTRYSSSASADYVCDTNILTKDMSDGWIEALLAIEDGSDTTEYKWMDEPKLRDQFTGFFRTICHSPDHGVEYFLEGQMLVNGVHDEFGRIWRQEKTAISNEWLHFSDTKPVYSYTGWMPMKQAGLGIGTDDDDVQRGLYTANERFPDEGRCMWAASFCGDWQSRDDSFGGYDSRAITTFVSRS